MFRKDLLELLRAAPRSVEDIALLLELEPRDVEDNLRHLLKSVSRVLKNTLRCAAGMRRNIFQTRKCLKNGARPGPAPGRSGLKKAMDGLFQHPVRHTVYRVTITPARCRHCDFRFRSDKLHKPGKCPRCRQTWISPPLIQIAGPEAP